jgi:competence protein ComEC
MTAPFVWIYVCFAAGICAAGYVQVPTLVVAATFACAILSLRGRNFRVALAAHLLVVFVLGHLLMSTNEKEYSASTLLRWVRHHEKETVLIRGTVTRTPEIGRDYFSLQMRVASVGEQTVDGLARLTVGGTSSSYPCAGDTIETYARFRAPSNFLVPGGFDYARYLKKEGIHVLGSVKEATLVHTIGHSSSLVAILSRIRLRIILDLIQEFPSADADVLRALWLDDRTGLSQETEQRLIDAGVFHVIAISGFHVSVLLLVLFMLMKPRFKYPTALLIGGLFLLFYFLLLEGRTSITRSFLTFLIYSFALWRHEEMKWSNVIPLSALLQLLLNPGELYDTGYHLTYLSTAAICFIAVPLCGRIHRAATVHPRETPQVEDSPPKAKWKQVLARELELPSLLRKVLLAAVDFAVVSLSIQAVLLPYQAFVFHRIPFACIFANIVAIPLSGVLILFSLVLVVLFPLQKLLVPIISFLIKVFFLGTDLFSGVWLDVVPEPRWIIVALFYALLFCILAIRSERLRRCAFAGCVLCVVTILFLRHPDVNGSLRIRVLDVGQGDAILIDYPDGTHDLVDSGGFWNSEALDAGESILFPALSSLQVTRIHRVFLTHAHADHMGGLVTLMRYIPVEHFYVSRFPYGDAGFRHVVSNIAVSPEGIHAGTVFHQAGVDIRVLAPADSRHTSHVANDDSLVLLLHFEGKAILLPGDAEIPTEELLCASPPFRVDYIKVPHHGSKTSSTGPFLDMLRPKAAFVSVGKNNWFGHPNPQVMARYRQHHVLTYRTDQSGTITLTITHGTASISAYTW